jgi:hypothetical protein
MRALHALLLCPVLLSAQAGTTVGPSSSDLTVKMTPHPVHNGTRLPARSQTTRRPDSEPDSRGVPFGAFQLMRAHADPGPLNLSTEANSAKTIIRQIDAARKLGVRLVLVLTGGAHALYMSDINGVYQFDRAKWDAQLMTFDTPAIRDAIARAVEEGTVIGANVMDEPYVWGGPEGEGNTWGPKGTMTKARVDSLCAAVQELFPTLPAGVGHQHQLFEPGKRYRVCQFIEDQYSASYGNVTAWRDEGLEMAKRDGYTNLFSMNVLNGGDQDKDGNWDCAGTGGKGGHAPNCRMTAEQVERFGLALGPSGCGLLMWRYDASFWERPENQAAFRAVADSLARVPRRTCTRAGTEAPAPVGLRR